MADKFTKSDVGFEHPAKGEDHCGQCVHYERARYFGVSGGCAIVKGKIEPEDWCKKFEKMEEKR